MPKTAMINARIEPKLKREVEEIFRQIGLNTAQAITLFFQNVKNHGGIPFDVKIPNETTRKVIDDSRRGKNLVKAKNADEMFKKLGI